jgi:hypothetical protein
MEVYERVPVSEAIFDDLTCGQVFYRGIITKGTRYVTAFMADGTPLAAMTRDRDGYEEHFAIVRSRQA